MTILVGGTLLFHDEGDVHLQAEYILITDGGTLQVGTEEEPFQHQATITLHGNLRSKELPIYGAKVLGVRNGNLDLHGECCTSIDVYNMLPNKIDDPSSYQ